MATANDQVKMMIANLPGKIGNSLDPWLAIVAESKLEKHGTIVKPLKPAHGVTHGSANLVVPTSRSRTGN